MFLESPPQSLIVPDAVFLCLEEVVLTIIPRIYGMIAYLPTNYLVDLYGTCM